MWRCLGVYGNTRTGLPVEDGGEELPDQPLVIWLELLGIDGLVGFGVQVVRVEGPDGNQRLLICLVAQMAVRALSMPPMEKKDMRDGIKPRKPWGKRRRTGRSCGIESYEGQLQGDCTGSSTRCTGTANEKKKKRGGATDQHQGICKSTIRGATGKVRGVLATYHIV